MNMSSPITFTPRSLQIYLEQSSPDADSWLPPADGGWGILSKETPDGIFIVARGDNVNASRIVYSADFSRKMGDLPHRDRLKLLKRTNQASQSALTKDIRLPAHWGKYQHANLLAFYAIPREVAELRAVMEIFPRGSNDIYFVDLNASSSSTILERYDVEHSGYDGASREWPDVFADLSSRLKTLRSASRLEALDELVDLDATSFRAVAGSRTYSQWLPEMTPEQRTFFDAPTTRSLKLRGPAGSGKTLLLQLKALKELYDAAAQSRECRIGYVTHSWVMADQADKALRYLDEKGLAADILVRPLLVLAQDNLPAERRAAGFSLLGEDNVAGKKEQFQRIRIAMRECKGSDWLAYRDGASRSMVEAMAATPDTPQEANFIWALMNEFASVLGANGILPGILAERQYQGLPRATWMMPLETRADKTFVLRIYTRYLRALERERLLSSDQLINDYLNYLETYQWNLARKENGFDLIFVDELHLFNEQERLAINLLSRDPDSYPRIFMALDPRQSPAVVYGNGAPARSPSGSGAAELQLGEVAALDLRVVHRFADTILALVKHLHRAYPPFELGDDWVLDQEALTATSESGDRPVLYRVNEGRDAAVTASLAKQLFDARQGRVAIIVLENAQLDRFAEACERADLGYTLIGGKGDQAELQYKRRTLVVTTAEYAAGLQFEAVVISGAPAGVFSNANVGFHKRDVLSRVYLAVTRATSTVYLVLPSTSGLLAELLETAEKAGLLVVK